MQYAYCINRSNIVVYLFDLWLVYVIYFVARLLYNSDCPVTHCIHISYVIHTLGLKE